MCWHRAQLGTRHSRSALRASRVARPLELLLHSIMTQQSTKERRRGVGSFIEVEKKRGKPFTLFDWIVCGVWWLLLCVMGDGGSGGGIPAPWDFWYFFALILAVFLPSFASSSLAPPLPAPRVSECHDARGGVRSSRGGTMAGSGTERRQRRQRRSWRCSARAAPRHYHPWLL